MADTWPRRPWVLAASLLLNAVIVLVGVAYVAHKGGLVYVEAKLAPQSPTPDFTFEARSNLFVDLPDNSQSVVFLGDSITANCEWGELLHDPAVINRGIGGDTTERIIGRLTPVMAGHPRAIFLMAGVNDLFQGATVGQTAQRYASLLADIREGSPATTVFVQSVLPVDRAEALRWYASAPSNGTIEDLDRQLASLASTDGDYYINLWPVFAVNGSLNPALTVDGLHPNGQGYLDWAKMLQPYLAALARP